MTIPGIASIWDRIAPGIKPDTERQEGEAAGLIDKRRWLSFLTWAFVLNEMAGRDGFLPNAAHAGDEDPPPTAHHGEDGATAASQLPNIAVTTDAEGVQPVLYQRAAAMPTEASPGHAAGDLAEPHTPAGSAPEVAAFGGSGGGGGQVQEPVAAMDAGDFADGSGLDIATPPLLGIGADGKLIDLGLQLDLGDSLHDVLDNVGQALGTLGPLGQSLGSVTGTIADTTDSLLSSLSPVTSLVGLGTSGSDGGYDNLGICLPGQLLFGSGEASANQLANETGGYTNYGIALSTNFGDAPISGTVEADIGGSALDALALDHLAPTDLHDASDALHFDQTILRTASDVLV